MNSDEKACPMAADRVGGDFDAGLLCQRRFRLRLGILSTRDAGKVAEGIRTLMGA